MLVCRLVYSFVCFVFLWAFTDRFVFQPAEKPVDRAKKEAPKDKAKTKPSAAAQKNKKTDKNAEKKAKEEEAALEKDADELHKAIEGRCFFLHCITRNTLFLGNVRGHLQTYQL